MIDEITVLSLKKNKSKYIVSLSNGKELEATEDLVLKYRLVEKHVLDPEDLVKIKDDALYFNLYEKAIRYLSKNMTSKGKMIDYLISKDASENLAGQMVSELEQKKLLDDKIYMEALCNHYIRNGYGKYYIISIAYKYKIDKSLACEILDAIDESEFINSCIYVGKKKLKTLNNYDELKKKNKLIQYLQNRGFDFDLINQCIKEII